MNEFIEVDLATFYEKIGPLEVTPTFTADPYPYTSEFITTSRRVLGRVVGYYPEGSMLAAKRFYLHESLIKDTHETRTATNT